MPLTDIETGQLLQKVEEMGNQLVDMNARLMRYQPVWDEMEKQMNEKRSRNLQLTVATIIGFSLFFLTAATWYIRSGGAVPYNTVPQSTVGASHGR